ncbi:MAG: hypothetical protein IT324_05695 [Anaerolineae bacterium]|nr:hypothetical protein [Anaerolineae bacterium]
MNRLPRLFIIVAVLSAVFTCASVRPAAAIPVDITCNSIRIDGPGGLSGSFPIIDITTMDIVGFITFVDNGGSSTGSGSFSAPTGHILQHPFGLFAVPPCGGGSTTWFNPGDSRVSPAAGDRLAVYCNTSGPNANTIGILGIRDDGNGVPLALVNYSDLIKAGGKGITVSAEPNGSIVIWMTSPNNFLVKWWGGQWDASGYGDFRKRFSCTFK